MRFIQAYKEDINIEDRNFIENLKRFSTPQEERSIIVFDKKDITLKIDIDGVDMKILNQKYYSKIDVKINDKIKSEDIIKMLEHIPKHLELRLEADNIEEIIELMNSEILIRKLKEQRTKFLLKGIEIEPRIIKSKMDGDDLKSEVKEIETKRDRLRIDCDK